MQQAVVILDGASGDPIPELDGRTSLEAAHTPNLDIIASTGMVGLMQNVPDGMESCSNVACLSIVGYDPAAYPIGRGAIEGAALGIDLKPGQVAMRLNLCYVENDIMRSYSTDNISTEDGHALAREIKEALDDEVFTLYLGTSFRQILVVDGHRALMDLDYVQPHEISDEAVAGRDIPCPHDGETPEQRAAIAAITHYIDAANRLLAQSAVNARRVEEGLVPATNVWLFWPGERPDSMPTFFEAYGKRASMNSAVDLLDGIALLTDMRTYKREGITDGPNNDFALQGRVGLEMLEDGADVVVIHVEAPDAAGHDGRPDEKVGGIEKSDTHILGPLLDYARTHPVRIAVMPDHPTPLTTRKHSYDFVPFAVMGPGIESNGADRMTESQARATGLTIERGHTFMKDVLLADGD